MASDAPKRRTLQRIPGTNISALEHAAALCLYNTYQVEKARFVNQHRLADNAYTPGKFIADFGETRAGRRKVSENFEDEISGVTERHAGKLWLELAAKLIAKRIDPDAFIRMQFMDLRSGMHPPSEEALTGDLAMARYFNGKSSVLAAVCLAMTVQANKFRGEMMRIKYSIPADKRTNENVWLMVLSAPSLQLSALFIYCTAVGISNDPATVNKKDFKAVAKAYLSAATLQFVFCPEAYLVAWCDMLPAGFSDLAEKTYLAMYGNAPVVPDFDSEEEVQDVQD